MPRAAPNAKIALRCFMLHGRPKNPSTIPRRANVFVAVGICRTWHRPLNLASFPCQVRRYCVGSTENFRRSANNGVMHRIWHTFAWGCGLAMMPLAVSLGENIAATEVVQIPAGGFLMGSNDGPQDERPQHKVQLAAYWIDPTPVTNAQFAQFLNAIGPQGPQGERYYDIDDNDARVRRRDGKWLADSGSENYPVVEASWYGALAYCRWLGKRLPMEAEWGKAARGTDGRKYPWGNEPPDKTRAHFGAGWNDLRPVDAFPNGASPYGVLAMAGNGWGWV